MDKRDGSESVAMRMEKNLVDQLHGRKDHRSSEHCVGQVGQATLRRCRIVIATIMEPVWVPGSSG